MSTVEAQFHDPQTVATAEDYRRRKTTSVLAVVFTDIAQSTELRERLGEVEYEDLRESHDQSAASPQNLRKGWKFNPAVPVKGWRTAWRKLTRAITCPACFAQQSPGRFCGECRADIRNVRSSLHGLRFHDLRHHAITELCESGASEQTIKAIAGHVSQRMLDRYSHIRLEAKRQALQGLSGKGYGTNNGTKSEPQPLVLAATH